MCLGEPTPVSLKKHVSPAPFNKAYGLLVPGLVTRAERYINKPIHPRGSGETFENETLWVDPAS